jgi:uncharacterized protein (DUF1800 family)
MHSNLLRIIPPLNFRSQAALLFVSLAVATSAQAQVPSWWATGNANATSNNVRKPVTNGNSALDLGVATVGQAKFIAWQARLELESKFPEIGGAGEGIKAATDKFWLNNSSDKAVIAIGQVKYLSKLYYDRLFQLGMIKTRSYLYDDDANPATPRILTTSVAGNPREIYPWTAALGSDDSDSSPATLGQLKKAFSFEISVPLIAGSGSAESDGDSIPDWVEFQLGLNPTDNTQEGKSRDAVKFAALKKGANCKGYEGTYTGAANQKPSRENASRFLNQATWGANLVTIDALRNLPPSEKGVYATWIDNQIWDTSDPRKSKTLQAMEPSRMNKGSYPSARSTNYQIVHSKVSDTTDKVTVIRHKNYQQAREVDEDRVTTSVQKQNYAWNNISRLEGYTTYIWAREFLDAKIQGRWVDEWAGYGSSGNLYYPANQTDQYEATGSFFEYLNTWKTALRTMPGSAKEKIVSIDYKEYDNGIVKPIASVPNVMPGDPNRDALLGPLCRQMMRDIRGGEAPTPATNQGLLPHDTWYARFNTNYPGGPGVLATAWMRNVVHGSDPLRQRVAFALSQILVVSLANNTVDRSPMGVAKYYDLLSDQAFGNYAILLKNVTFSPAMGAYLSHLHNDGSVGKKADENYARELMQLFSIGIWKLNLDGTFVLDKSLQRIPTYSSNDVRELAKVFTGFRRVDLAWGQEVIPNHHGYSDSMVIEPTYHNFESKTLNMFYGGNAYNTPVVAEDAMGAEFEIESVVEKLAKDLNTAPFISSQLIKKLVTSNPSSDYVKRVATVFYEKRDDPSQMGYVVKAILMDPEARNFESILNPRFGKLKEPILRMTNLVKSLNAGKHRTYTYDGTKDLYLDGTITTTEQRYFPSPEESGYNPYTDIIWAADLSASTKQQFMKAPSVFNFYEPGFVKSLDSPNSNDKEQIFAPEFQVMNSSTTIGILNTLFNSASEEIGLNYYQGGPNSGMIDYFKQDYVAGYFGRRDMWEGESHVGLWPLDTTPFNPDPNAEENLIGLASINPSIGKRFLCDTNGAICLFSTNEDRYLAEIDLLICNGNMSYKTKEIIRLALKSISDPNLANMMGIHMALATPEAAIQH